MDALVSALLQAGIITQDEATTLTLMLNPVQAQAFAESLLTSAAQQGLSAQQMRLVDLLRTRGYDLTTEALDVFWQNENNLLATAWVDEYQRIATSVATAALMETNGLAAWQAVNEEVIDWVNTYYRSGNPLSVGSIPNINDTSRAAIADIFNQWQRGDLQVPANVQGLPRLIRAMEPVFGAERASAIAVTESTRIYAQSGRTAALENEFVTMLGLQTAADERVCPICGPMHGQRIDKGAAGFTHPMMGFVGFPPFHVNCRCRHFAMTERTQGLVVPEDTYDYGSSR
jgi:SPP1 gp7 family putative phage head morphogenesis protein